VSTESATMKAIRKIAMKYPETETGTSCNKVSYKAGKKSFVFVGSNETSYNVMLKVQGNLAEAQVLQAPRQLQNRLARLDDDRARPQEVATSRSVRALD
jgi:hypothetical protein